MRFSFFVFLVFIASCSSKKFCSDSSYLKLVGQIDLQAGFDNDLLSLKIDSFIVVNQILVNSESSSDYSGIKIKFYKAQEGSFFYIISTKKDKKISFIDLSLDKNIELLFVIDKQEIKLKYNFEKGKYLGVSKSTIDGEINLYLIPSFERFVYY